jgi:predicted RNA polymerase sigma factor
VENIDGKVQQGDHRHPQDHRRERRSQQHASEGGEADGGGEAYGHSRGDGHEMDDVYMESEVKDDVLRLLFVCADPSIPLESQLVSRVRRPYRFPR